MADKPVIGKFYKVIHTRKGTFFGKVVAIDGSLDEEGSFIRVEITAGRANAIMDYNMGYPGDVIGCRNSLALFYEVPESEAQETKT